MIEGRPRESLVLYDNPIEVCMLYIKFFVLFIFYWRSLVVWIQMIHLRRLLDVSEFKFWLLQTSIESRKKGNLPPMDNKPKQEDILNAILPPREWTEQGKSWNVYHRFCNWFKASTISSTLATSQLPELMLLSLEKCLTKNWWRDKQEKAASVQFVKNCFLSVLMKSYAK